MNDLQNMSVTNRSQRKGVRWGRAPRSHKYGIEPLRDQRILIIELYYKANSHAQIIAHYIL